MNSSQNSSQNTIVFVTRDIERAMAKIPDVNYRIVTNRTPYADTIAKQYHDFVYIIDSDVMMSTADLMSQGLTKKIISETNSSILVFKNTSRITSIANDNGWKLLNPSALLGEKIENKITQVEWLGHMSKEYLPDTTISKTSACRWTGNSFIIQWAHGHTGDGTILIDSETGLREIQTKYPDRDARITQYVNGPSFTVNVVVGSDKIMSGNISYQITGLSPFTDNRFSTIGNDWGIVHKILTTEDIATIEKMSHEIGGKLRDEGWRGLFGIDLIKDLEKNKILLIEINARQPASTVFESFLQEKNRKQDTSGYTIFEAHLRALQNERLEHEIVRIDDGAQVIQRITNSITEISEDMIGSLNLAGYRVIPYTNTEYNRDLLRIQSDHGIMESHNIFNSNGNAIISTITSS